MVMVVKITECGKAFKALFNVRYLRVPYFWACQVSFTQID